MEFQWGMLLAGIGAFLFGMQLMEHRLRSLAGREFKLFVKRSSGTLWRSLFSGAIVTAALQSSSMVSLLVMSLAGAGVIGLQSGIGLLLGANIGTTITGWLVSTMGLKFDLATLAYPLLALGGLFAVFSKEGKWRAIAAVVFGLALIFTGIGMMRDSFASFSEHASELNLQAHSHAWFLICGLVVAAVLHSSSATVALALTSLSAGVVSLEQSMLLVIGADMGTTATAALATLKANAIKKRVGWSQVFFNVFSALMAWLMLPIYVSLSKTFDGYFDSTMILAAFHTSMNVVGIFLFIPLIPVFSKKMESWIKADADSLTVSIHDSNPLESQSAIEALDAESHKFFSRTLSLLREFFNLDDGTPSRHVRSYPDLKKYENEIALFGIRVQANQLTEREAKTLENSLTSIRNAAISAKDVKDILHNIDELRSSASDELFGFYQSITHCQKEFYNNVEEAFQLHGSDRQESLVRLKTIAADVHRLAAQDVYRLFSNKDHQDISVPSLLNLVRAINNSNESLLRAIEPELEMPSDRRNGN
ncbi:MAG: Na/Pi cotransporter family protein [Bacteroidota bacterium]